jgi:uncharacterized protein (DUF1800 family)
VKGEFIFRRFQHDYGQKTDLGKTGNFEGEDVLDILLEQKQTARFITQKIYRFFVNDTVDKEKTEWLADRFYKSGYNIAQLMEDIFTSDWFYDEKNIGVKIKSPIELLAGIRRMLPMDIQNDEAQLVVQRILGQMLFYPPNVAGWPGGKTWIDSSTLMMRLRLPQLINDQDELNVRPKMDDDQMMGRADDDNDVEVKNKRKGYNKIGKPINATIEWDAYTRYFEAIPRESLLSTIAGSVLQVKMGVPAELIKNSADSTSRESFIKSVTLQLMSVPEYQMC